MSSRRLLISYAHPDDESFGLGGLIAKYVSEGVDVYLICATNGDVGTVSSEHLSGYESVKALRLAELDCAASVLGLKQVFTFGYRDSGMMGSETSQDASCLWQADQVEVTRRVVEVIREIQPQVIITFNSYGGYGHPDHIAIQKATTAAFSAAGAPDYVTAGQSPYKPQKLYYSSIPLAYLRFGLLMIRLRGQDPRHLGKNRDIDMMAVLENVEPTHTRINVRRFYDQWDQASACHKSQLGGGFSNLPLSLRKIIAPTQGFTRIYPAPMHSHVDEHDLFANVSTAEITAEPTR